MQRVKLKEMDQIFAELLSNGSNKEATNSQVPTADLEELKIMKIVGEKHLENLIKSVDNKNFTQVA